MAEKTEEASAAARAAARAARARADGDALCKSEAQPHNLAKEAERRTLEAETAANREGATKASKGARPRRGLGAAAAAREAARVAHSLPLPESECELSVKYSPRESDSCTVVPTLMSCS